MTAFVGPSFQTKLEAVIPASSSLDVDVLPSDVFCSLDYRVCLVESSRNRFFKMVVGKKQVVDFETSVGRVHGDIVDVDASYEADGANGKLVLKNNEAIPVTARILRTIVT